MKPIRTSLLAGASLALASLFGVVDEAHAQSGCQYIAFGAVLTAAQWNSCFQAKLDNPGFVPLNPSNLVGSATVAVTPSGPIITLSSGCTGSGAFGVGNGTGAQCSLTAGSVATLNGGPLTISPTAASTTQGFNITQSGPTSGSGAAFFSFNEITISSDATNITSQGNIASGLGVFYSFGGSNSQGMRGAVTGFLSLTSATSGSSNDRDYVAGIFQFNSAVSDGGTNLGAGAKGSGFGINPSCVLNSGATNIFACEGGEVDVTINTGASARYRWGWSMASLGSVNGSDPFISGGNIGEDAAIAINAASGNVSWMRGISFTDANGGTPIDSRGCVMCTNGGAHTVTTGIDFSAWTFTGNAVNFGNFLVPGTGASLNLAGRTFLNTVAGATTYNAVNDSAGNNAFVAGGGGGTPDHTNYYENTTHQFTNIGGGTGYMTIATGATGIKFGQYGLGLIHSSAAGVLSSSAVSLTVDVTGVLPVANGGTNCSSASITCFNNITGFSAAGTTGTTSTNLVFSTSPSITTPTFVTSATGPVFIGGTAAGAALELRSTSGNGSGDVVKITGGNNGSTALATFYGNAGTMTLGSGTPPSNTTVLVTTNGNQVSGASGTGSAALLQLVGANSTQPIFAMNAFGTASNAVFASTLARGTAASPTTVVSGDNAFTFNGYAYDGTNYDLLAQFSFIAKTMVANTSASGEIRFLTVSANSPNIAMYILPSSGVAISSVDTTDPGAGGLLITGQQFNPNITTSSAAQNGTVCWTTGTGKFTVDTTVGCLTSIEDAKDILSHYAPWLAIVDQLDPFSFRYKKGWGDSGRYEQFGLGAHQVAMVDERLVGRDPEGTLQGVRYQELTAVLSGAIKQIIEACGTVANDNFCIELKRRAAR